MILNFPVGLEIGSLFMFWGNEDCWTGYISHLCQAETDLPAVNQRIFCQEIGWNNEGDWIATALQPASTPLLEENVLVVDNLFLHVYFIYMASSKKSNSFFDDFGLKKKKIYKIHSYLIICSFVYLIQCALCINFELAHTLLWFLLKLLSEILCCHVLNFFWEQSYRSWFIL